MGSDAVGSRNAIVYTLIANTIRKTGDIYNRTRLTPFLKKLMGKWLSWTR